MKLKTSFFNTSVLKKDITRFAPLWGLYTVFMLLFLFLVWGENAMPAQFAREADQIMMLMGVVNCGYAGLAALLLFGDLFKARLCYAVHALPLRREGWFLTHFAAGMLFCLAPNALGAVIAGAMLGQYAFLAYVWLGLMILQYLCFFGIGVLYRKYEHRISHHLIWAAVGAAIVVGASYLKWCGMNVRPTTFDPLTLPITGIAGWIMTYNISYHLARIKPSAITRFLAYCGNKSLYILVWHICAYKIVSLIKIYYYDLDIRQIGCHMVIHFNAANDLFWILYTIVGVGVPIGGYYLYSKYLAPRLPKFNWLVK